MFVFSGKSGFCLSLIRELTRALNVELTSTLSVKFRDFSCDHFTPLIKQFARTKNNFLSATQKILFKIISNIFHVNFCVDSRHWRENKSRFAKPRLSACNSNEYWLKTEQFLLFLFPLSNRPPFFLQHVQREAMENAVRVSIATRLIQLQTRCAIVQSAVGWSWPRARLYWLACTTGSSRVKGVTHLRRAEGRWCLWDVPGALSVKHENDFLWAERRVMCSSTQERWWCWWWKNVVENTKWIIKWGTAAINKEQGAEQQKEKRNLYDKSRRVFRNIRKPLCVWLRLLWLEWWDENDSEFSHEDFSSFFLFLLSHFSLSSFTFLQRDDTRVWKKLLACVFLRWKEIFFDNSFVDAFPLCWEGALLSSVRSTAQRKRKNFFSTTYSLIVFWGLFWLFSSLLQLVSLSFAVIVISFTTTRTPMLKTDTIQYAMITEAQRDATFFQVESFWCWVW